VQTSIYISHYNVFSWNYNLVSDKMPMSTIISPQFKVSVLKKFMDFS